MSSLKDMFKLANSFSFTTNIDDYFQFVMNRMHTVIETMGLTSESDEVIIISSEGQNAGGTTSDYTTDNTNGATIRKNYKIWFLNNNRDPRLGNETQALPSPLNAKTPEEFMYYREIFAPEAILEITANAMVPAVGLGCMARVEERADGRLYLFDIKQIQSAEIYNLFKSLGLDSTVQQSFGRKVYPSAASRVGDPSKSSTNKIKPEGWSTSPGVVLNDLIVSFVNEVTKKAPTTPIIVNSGYRSPKRQAVAVVKKMQLGDKLKKIYNNRTVDHWIGLTGYVDGVASPNFGTKEISIMQKWYEDKDWTGTTSHLTGKAVDFKTIHLSDQQLSLLKAAISAVGEYALFETTPEHIHVSIKSFKAVGGHDGKG
ncbi:hypothetical protein N8467_00390 [bacterium]|nr:hypothetical protein [bacterium]